MTGGVRYDKHGRRLPDTGRGCGCRLCEESDAPRYERRAAGASSDRRSAWHPLHRTIARLMLG